MGLPRSQMNRSTGPRLRGVDKGKQRREQTYHNRSAVRGLKKGIVRLTSAPLTPGTFGFRRERCIVWGGNMKYVHRFNGQASADPIGACERQCENFDAGGQAPPIRSHGPNGGLRGPETEHEE